MYNIHVVKRFRAHCGFYSIENKLLLLLLLCNNTAPRRPTYGTPADRGPLDILHGISVFL